MDETLLEERNNLIELLKSATREVVNEYFQLPIAEKEDPIYRERHYCYELYHWIRLLKDNYIDPCTSFGGEVDKSGHPHFRDSLKDRKPDIIIHEPGNMNSNLCVIEVKPINGASDGFEKDLKTLILFRKEADYHHSVFLIYGSDEESSLTGKIRTARSKHSLRSFLDEDFQSIVFLWHKSSGYPAILIHPFS